MWTHHYDWSFVLYLSFRLVTQLPGATTVTSTIQCTTSVTRARQCDRSELSTADSATGVSRCLTTTVHGSTTVLALRTGKHHFLYAVGFISEEGGKYRPHPHIHGYKYSTPRYTIGQFLIAWFNDCILDESGQNANPIIAKVDPVPYYSIHACLCLRIYY